MREIRSCAKNGRLHASVYRALNCEEPLLTVKTFAESACDSRRVSAEAQARETAENASPEPGSSSSGAAAGEAGDGDEVEYYN